ncbi:MAG: hypothetical protein H6603_07640 [Flavobacteriales bacterium]|nr:hypothetical protein [Flavobacteriales bacterium]MCB9190871.1 hypothetical protein [Flavobacteriales bacterium]MCB9204835.1 hypothetical protein [Flavobacteriales bacterium]
MKSLSALLLVLFLPFHGEWELKKDKDGIKLYTKHEEGYAIKAVRAETTFHAPLEACVAVLRDIDNLIELFPDCQKVVKVKQDENSQIHYLQLKAPWPVTDRDGAFGLKYRYDRTKDMVIIEAEMVEGAYPQQNGFIRLNKGKGTWKFKRLDAEHTQLDYYYLGDAGGAVPAWVANTVIEESPFRMLTNFHKLVKLERYQGKKFSFMQ